MDEPTHTNLPAAQQLAAAALARLASLRAPSPPDKRVRTRLDNALSQARDAYRQACADSEPLGRIAALAGLDDRESEILAVVASVELDEQLQQLIVSVTNDRQRHRVEVGMLAHLLGVAGPANAGPDSALQRSALLSIEPSGAFGRGVVSVAPRVLWALTGDDSPDPALPADSEFLRADLEPSDDGDTAVLVVGRDRVRSRQRAVTQMRCQRCLAVRDPRGDTTWRAVVREATLSGAAVLVELRDELDEAGQHWIEAATHIRWALCSRNALDLARLPRRNWREYDADDSDPGQAEWEHALGTGVPRLHRLTAEQLETMRLALAARGEVGEAYRRLTSPRLDALCQHIRPRASWDDLVLSTERKGLLRDLADRYRLPERVYRDWGFTPSPSRGLIALFSGSSGTGKTLAAEVLAGELGVDVYRLDLSSVMSKYIGETEKNLEELFAAASAGSFVLFFDEADALFAKRGEVADAHDRYANVETSYLLQRLERYDGLAVLATNYEKNIDQAFMRRIHVRIDFPLPGKDERFAIWKRQLAVSAPLDDDIDAQWLADTFELTGANIRNAVLDAAFLAAAAEQPIGMAVLVRGVARELRKLGRLVTASTFGEWYDATNAITEA